MIFFQRANRSQELFSHSGNSSIVGTARRRWEEREQREQHSAWQDHWAAHDHSVRCSCSFRKMMLCLFFFQSMIFFQRANRSQELFSHSGNSSIVGTARRRWEEREQRENADDGRCWRFEQTFFFLMLMLKVCLVFSLWLLFLFFRSRLCLCSCRDESAQSRCRWQQQVPPIW